MDKFKIKNLLFTSFSLFAFFTFLGFTTNSKCPDANLGQINNKDIVKVQAETTPFSNDNISYELASNNQVLVISGSGAIRDYSPGESRPWDYYAEHVDAIEIEEGITSIGANAFSNFEKIFNVQFCANLNFINEYAFANCPNLITVSFTQNEYESLEIADKAFDGCSEQGNVFIPESMSESFTHSSISDITLSNWQVKEKTLFVNNTESKNASWVLSDKIESDTKSETILFIDGTGNTDDYNSFPLNQPWSGRVKEITKIIVGNHIKRIGTFVFQWTHVDNAIIGDSVEELGDGCFFNSAYLNSISIPKNARIISSNAFQQCNSLVTFNINGDKIDQISDSAIQAKKGTFYVKPENEEKIKQKLPADLLAEGNWTITPTKVQNPSAKVNNGNTENDVYDNSIEVSLISNNAEEILYYTLDGSDPTINSFQYNEKESIKINALKNTTIDNTVTLKIISTRYCWDSSDIVTYKYKIKNQIDKPTPKILTFTYNGEVHTLLSPNELYDVKDHQQTNAGEYTATLTLRNTENCIWSDGNSDPHTIPYEIKKASFDLTGIDFTDTVVQYNGEVQPLRIKNEENLPEGLTVTYKYSTGGKEVEPKEAKSYSATAIFHYDKDNYEEVKDKKVTYEITKRVIAKPKEDPTNFIYDGSEKKYTLSDYSELKYFTIEGDTQTNAGSYEVSLTLKDTNNTTWESDNNAKITYSFVIAKGTYSFTNSTFKDTEITYDGKEHSLRIDDSLPEGLEVTYSGKGTNVGTYNITATFTGDYLNYHEVDPLTVKLAIKKFIVNNPEKCNDRFIYNKNEQTYPIPSSNYYTISNNKQTNAGSYIIEVDLIDKENTCWEDNTTNKLTFPFVIEKANYDISKIEFNNKSVEYDGLSHTIEVQGQIPEGIKINYVGEHVYTEAGKYDITIELCSENENYNELEVIQKKLTIEKKSISKPSKDETIYVYDGSEKTYKIDESEYYTVSDHSMTNAGQIKIVIELKDKKNYRWYPVDSQEEEINDLYYTFTINKATYDMSKISFPDNSFTYDGQGHSLEINGDLPKGLEVSYNISNIKNSGSYIVIASFSSNEIRARNYEPIENMSATLTIYKFKVEKPQEDDTEYVYNGQKQTYVVAPSDYYRVKNQTNIKTNAGNYIVEIELIDLINYVWEDDTTPSNENLRYHFEIKKADYDLSKITFPSMSFEYTGEIHSLAISGDLPEGLSVKYENNDQSQPGEYEVVANFTGDMNHNAVSPLTSTLTITSAIEKLETPEASISVDGGFITNIHLVTSEKNITDAAYSFYIASNEVLLKIYDISIYKLDDETIYELDPTKSYTLRIKLPESLSSDKEFIIAHIHGESEVHYIRKGTSPSIGSFVIEDGYIVTKINKLSDFLFIEKKLPLTNESVCYIHLIQTILLVFYISFFLIYVILLKHLKFNLWNIIGDGLFAIGTILLSIFRNCNLCDLINIISASIIFIAITIHVLLGYTLSNKNKPENSDEKEDEAESKENEEDREDNNEVSKEENEETPDRNDSPEEINTAPDEEKQDKSTNQSEDEVEEQKETSLEDSNEKIEKLNDLDSQNEETPTIEATSSTEENDESKDKDSEIEDKKISEPKKRGRRKKEESAE